MLGSWRANYATCSSSHLLRRANWSTDHGAGQRYKARRVQTSPPRTSPLLDPQTLAETSVSGIDLPSQGVPPTQISKSAEVLVCGDKNCSVFQRQCGKGRIAQHRTGRTMFCNKALQQSNVALSGVDDEYPGVRQPFTNDLKRLHYWSWIGPQPRISNDAQKRPQRHPGQADCLVAAE